MQERDVEWLAPTIARHIHGASVLLGMQSLKDMMSFGTDFEMHAMWQGYIIDLAVKDFISRKAHTNTLSKE